MVIFGIGLELAFETGCGRRGGTWRWREDVGGEDGIAKQLLGLRSVCQTVSWLAASRAYLEVELEGAAIENAGGRGV